MINKKTKQDLFRRGKGDLIPQGKVGQEVTQTPSQKFRKAMAKKMPVKKSK